MGIAALRYTQRTGLSIQDEIREPFSIPFHDFEKAVVRRLLGDNFDEALTGAVAYMAMAMRMGHLCVRINKERLRPDPASLIHDNVEETDLLRWAKEIKSGLKKLPEKLRSENGPIVQIDYPDGRQGFYFKRNWELELDLHRLLTEMDRSPPKILFSKEKVLEKLSNIGEKLLPEQAEAIEKALSRRLTVVTGGPGTGKSYTAARFLEVYRSLIPDKTPVVALAAPTGKAAANLQQKISEGSFEAKTIHALLEMGRNGRRRFDSSCLEADVVIIDECSMIDAPLMCELLAAVKPGARLILLGDNDQLPPVEVGSLFADMVDMLGQKESLATSRLLTCVRAELKGIIDLAEAVNTGCPEVLFPLLDEGREGIQWHEQEDREAAELALKMIAKDFDFLEDDPEQVADHFSSKRLLAPLRKGVAGLEQLNERLAEKHYRVSRSKRMKVWLAPVIATANDYRLGVYNGEGGLLMRHMGIGRFKPHAVAGDVILLRDSEGNWRHLPAALLPHVELAYCLSVHKSQGSEFDEVLLLLPSNAASFGKEVVYTGITRAKRSLQLFTTKATLKRALSSSSRRISGLTAALPSSLT